MVAEASPSILPRLLPPRVIAVACSAGGLGALETLLSGLPGGFPVPILVAQHRSDHHPSLLPELLNARTSLAVTTAQHLGRVAPGSVYVCPPGRHIQLANSRQIRILDGPRIRFVRPSADLLFQSVAEVFGDRGVCIVLTGHGHDGAAGTRAVRAAGGLVIAQHPATCQAADMPIAAVDLGRVDLILPLNRIAPALTRLAEHPNLN